MIKNTTIKVGVKIKPAANNKQIIIKSQKNSIHPPTVLIDFGNDIKKFHVDAIHDANIDKGTMFSDLHIDRFVEKFINGFNVTIMAYGHTGAGKTYCIQGNNEDSGIITDSIKMIYERAKPQVTISCSYMQLYNQKIYDLLVDDGINADHLKLRYEIQRDFIVQDLTTHEAKQPKQLQKLMRKGTKNRIIASNKVHDMSSRSHALFSIVITDKDQENHQRIRQMTFVDLAGSQRLIDSIGRLSKQSIEINKSLFVLRKVIKILQQATTQNKQMYVPYRDSKLTSLLKGALGGNCLTMIIACIDSITDNKQQTLLTLNYALSAGRIKNTARVNIDHQTLENKQLKIENQKLKKQLAVAWEQLDIMHKRQKMGSGKKSINQYSDKIIQCVGTIRQLIKSNKQLRQELDQERKIKKQQKIQIQMLLHQKYLMKKDIANSQSQTHYQRKMHGMNSSSHEDDERDKKHFRSCSDKPMMVQKEQVAPHKLIKIRQVIGSTQTFSPFKEKQLKKYDENKKSIIRRKKFIIHKTQPDQTFHNRGLKTDRNQQ